MSDIVYHTRVVQKREFRTTEGLVLSLVSFIVSELTLSMITKIYRISLIISIHFTLKFHSLKFISLYLFHFEYLSFLELFPCHLQTDK